MTIEIAALLAPVIIVGAALITLPLALWQDAREDRRRAAKQATPHRP